MKIFKTLLFLILFTTNVLADTVIYKGPRMVVVTLETNQSLITKNTSTEDVTTSEISINGDITKTTTRYTTVTTIRPKYTKISHLVIYKTPEGSTYPKVEIASLTTEDHITTKKDKGVVVDVIVEKKIEIVEQPKNIPYTDTDLNLGIRTEGYNLDNNFYKTSEFFNDNSSKSLIKADSSYSRGWTGKDVIVAVADTGYLTSHSDLQGQIIASKDYTDTGINDTNGHGTHILGSIVALKNDIGMHGVAYDAKAISLKVGSSTYVNLDNAALGLSWAADQGAIVGNLSANSNYDISFRRNIVNVNNDIFRYSGNIYDYSNGSYYNNMDPLKWKEATDKGMIIVNSAGNQGLAVPANPGYFSTAVNSSGELLLGGKMLIVGAVDPNGTPYSWSNKAGHICQQYDSTTNTCSDKYKVSDFYLLAPGSTTSTSINGLTGSMKGTSMAAPIVTGGVALVGQMWPYMKGENIVKLLTTTANKDLPNYTLATHGQGLLDLDKATQPVGAVGIPTGGKTTSSTTKVSLNNSGGSGSALSSISNSGLLAHVMVVDDFDRDFYINLQNGITIKDKRKISDVSVQQDNVTYLPFNQAFGNFNYKSESNILPNLKVGFNSNYFDTLNEDYSTYIQQDFNLNQSFNIRTTLGNLVEKETWLGNESYGALSVGSNNITNFTQIGFDYIKNDNKFSFDIGKGFTKIKNINDSLIKNFSTIHSQSYKFGYERSLTNSNRIGMTYSLPSYITKGSTTLNLPYATTVDGEVLYENVRANLRSQTPEKNIGIYYTVDREQETDWSFKTNVEYRNNISGQSKENSLGFGLEISKIF